METSNSSTDSYRNSSSSSSNNSRRFGMQFSAANFIQAPLSALLEYSGVLRTRSSHQESESLINGSPTSVFRERNQNRLDDSIGPVSGDGEVSIRIIGEQDREGGEDALSADHITGSSSAVVLERQGGNVGNDGGGVGEGLASSASIAGSNSSNETTDGEAGAGVGGNNRDSSYQRYDIQQVARWIEQVLPFSLLLLVVFIRQHLQGFFVTILIAAVMFKSNDILRKQTALKGERKVTFLAGISVVFILHVVGVYWWFRNDDLLHPLVMLPPKAIPPFWHAIFIIMVNDTMVRQAAMILKLALLIYYKNSRGRNYRRQVK